MQKIYSKKCSQLMKSFVLIFTLLFSITNVSITNTKTRISHKNNHNKISLIKYMIKKAKYQKAISIIEKEMQKYPEYSDTSQNLHMLKILAQYKQSTEYENTLEESQKIIDNILEYKENFNINADDEKRIEAIESDLYLNCAKHFLKISKNYLTHGDYISAINHANNAIRFAQKVSNNQNKQVIIQAKGNTPEYIISLGEEKIREIIRTIGFFNVKARNIFNLSKILVKNFNSQVPSTREDLESLPGIGRKSANVILNCVYGESTIAVDTHIFRISNRMQIAPGKTPQEVEKGLMKVTPKKYLKEIHSILVLHGRYTCKARKPLCSQCPVSHLCPSSQLKKENSTKD
jgi:endonuclease-3